MLNKKALSATAAAQPLYVEDVFSTYLYTGDGTSGQTITNGIDLSGEGGLVWVKCRSAAQDNVLGDSERLGTGGLTKRLISNSTAAESSTTLFTLNNNGFTTNGGGQDINGLDEKYASWTFRKAEKFFDVVTFTTGSSLTNTNRRISHSLGSTPGFIIIKNTTQSSSWLCYHRSLGRGKYMVLNATDAEASITNFWGTADPTSTDFGINETEAVMTNSTYVAYLFAHDAGGFGDSGSDSIIRCGSYTGNGSTTGPVIDLSWESQWLLVKDTTNANAWTLFDNMRGLPVGGFSARLRPNSNESEFNNSSVINLLANGFQLVSDQSQFNLSGSTYIYIAIRRGPMKTPEAGTEVFTPLTAVPTSGIFQSNILTDSFWVNTKSTSSQGRTWVYDRLRGNDKILTPRTNNIQTLDTGTDAEGTYSASTSAFNRNEDFAGDAGFTNTDYDGWAFKRAPGFFDTVCYTGTGSATTVTHKLGVVPDLIFVKSRSTNGQWGVYVSDIGATKALRLHTNDEPSQSAVWWNDTSPTSSVFSVGTSSSTNGSGTTYIAYLFASLTGVSKVGSYTGNGSNQTINCGFTAGARFVMIKRTDSTGNWSVFDTARGIVSGNDPYVILNAPGTQSVSGTDSVDPDNSGFIVNQNTTSNLNVNAATYIFFAIA